MVRPLIRASSISTARRFIHGITYSWNPREDTRNQAREHQDRQAHPVEAHPAGLERGELVAPRQAHEEENRRHQHHQVQPLVDERRRPEDEVHEDQLPAGPQANVPLQRGHQVADDHHHAGERDPVAEQGQELAAQVAIHHSQAQPSDGPVQQEHRDQSEEQRRARHVDAIPQDESQDDDRGRVEDEPVDERRPRSGGAQTKRHRPGGLAASRRSVSPPRSSRASWRSRWSGGAPGGRRRRPESALDQRHHRNGALPQGRAQEIEGNAPHDEVRGPHREPRGDAPVVTDVLADGEREVVEEHDGQQRHEGAHPAAPMGPDAERHAEYAEHDARRRDRELLVDLHPVGVRVAVEVRRVLLRLPQLRQTHLTVALRRVPLLGERVVERQRDVVEPEAHFPVFLERVGVGLVDRAVQEPQGHPPIHLVREQLPVVRRDEPLQLGLPLVGHEDVPETHLVRRDLVDVDDEVPERVVEHALLQPGAGGRPHDLEHERLERVVGPGQGVDHEVAGHDGRADSEGQHRPEEPEGAHPARLHGDDLHVRGQAPERDQNREQDPDGYGEDHDGGEEIHEQQHHEVDRNTLVDDQVHQIEDAVDQQQEGADDHPEEKWGDQFLPDVAIEDPHGLTRLDGHSTGASAGCKRRERMLR